MWILVALGLGIPLAFAWFTEHAWEDYFITLRSSRNLVQGHGLVFNPGERVHTFTSPLGVLVPAFCLWVAGEQLALWLFRLANAVLLAAAAALVWRRFESLQLGRLGRITFFGLMLADAKLIDFSMNGMETAMLVFFLLFLWSELERPDGIRALPLGIGCAGLMWTRPDACILAVALILPHAIVRARATHRPGISWRPLLTGLAIGAALYLPWFAWAWWYYGSPVPHTIVAKSQVTPPVAVRDILLVPWRSLTGQSMLGDLFLPTYWFYGGWPALLRYLAYVLGLIGSFAWLIPRLPGAARRASLGVFIGAFYLCSIILFPWYSPPWMVLAALAIAFSVDHLAAAAAAAGRHGVAGSLRVFAALAVGLHSLVLIASAWQMRTQQRVVEFGVRQDIGQWLQAHADSGDTVFMEPLGYIGYYSRLKTYDYPGLSSPEVVAVIRSGARRLTDVIARLQPDWLVLRPFEIADRTRPENAAWHDYELVRVWDVGPQLDAITVLPGRAWVEHDARFHVFRRRTPLAPSSHPATTALP